MLCTKLVIYMVPFLPQEQFSSDEFKIITTPNKQIKKEDSDSTGSSPLLRPKWPKRRMVRSMMSSPAVRKRGGTNCINLKMIGFFSVKVIIIPGKMLSCKKFL